MLDESKKSVPRSKAGERNLTRAGKQVALEGRANASRCTLVVVSVATGATLAVDTLDITGARDRLRLVQRLPEEMRAEADELLLELAAELARGASADRSDSRQGRPVALADPIPWDVAVDGGEALSEVVGVFQRFVVMSYEAAVSLALWVFHAFLLDAAEISAVLCLMSPVKQCAKSRTLTLLGALVPRPLPTSNVTPATVFRTMEKFHPTLLMDEADTYLPGNDELRGILNSGHMRSMAVTTRVVGDEHEPRMFSTWGAKAVALIGRLPATLEDRAIVIPLRRRARDEKVERLRLDRLHRDLEPLRRKIARWALDNFDALRDLEPSVPEELSDRNADNWRPLLAIAERTGPEWAERARRAALLLSGAVVEGENAPGIQLLADLRELFDLRGRDRLSSAEIIESLTQLHERPWPEWRGGKPLTQVQLARLLKPFGISPTTVRLGDETLRGYLREDCDDAFLHYLPSDPQQPKQISNDAVEVALEKRNTGPAVSPSDSSGTPRQDWPVAPVVDHAAKIGGREQRALLRGVQADLWREPNRQDAATRQSPSELSPEILELLERFGWETPKEESLNGAGDA